MRRLLSGRPWFVDAVRPSGPSQPHQPPVPPPSLPDDAPSVLKDLQAELLHLPHLEPTSLLVSRPILPPSALALPEKQAQGRRKRGGTYAGESVFEDGASGLWSWVLLAQVKEGTENRGGIESVVRAVRKTLLLREPPLPLPPNHKRRLHNGWAMVDAGDFAVHILSKEARERYFGHWA
ncbi:hypothetical protein AX17_003422 [Amanita inopinata Kibby_2008]|nr:hypothetical protein AX17_003422 [Amanita inopinata Kibby_2008]